MATTRISFGGGSIETPKGNFSPTIPEILPHQQVFSIQVGDSMFRLSGASLSSDGPSFFTNFFLPYVDKPESERPTLYLDRSADIFDLICQHLRGYYVQPDCTTTLICLLCDAHYYHLPRLVEQIHNSEIFIRIGPKDFRIPRDLFSNKGDTPNFFTVGFDTLFGTGILRLKDQFPQTLRPPPVAPPTVTNRSADLFEDLLDILRGREHRIKSASHREALICECRYYRLLGLEQRLIPHQISPATMAPDGSLEEQEIVIPVEHIKRKNITKGKLPVAYYSRPYQDEPARQLVVQVKEPRTIRLEILDGGSDAPQDIDCDLYMVNMPETIRDKVQNLLESAHEALIGPYVKGPMMARIDSASLDIRGGLTNDNGKRPRPSSINLIVSQWRFVVLNDLLLLELLKGQGYSTDQGRNDLREFI
uniref:ARAD1D41118p n=1 Tax=Blastobotrys adeninivorans TaxID=409370 RepID=A0A060TIU5_BLAAD